MVLDDNASRDDLLKRLRRVEGQLRGVQRMIEEGEPCRKIGGQMSAARKALDSAYVRMTVCFAQQEMGNALAAAGQAAGTGPVADPMSHLGPILGEMEEMLLKRP
jgi:DNA-binding FrmR family transcriptional regulator